MAFLPFFPLQLKAAVAPARFREAKIIKGILYNL